MCLFNLTFEGRCVIFGEGQRYRMNDQHTQLAEEECKDSNGQAPVLCVVQEVYWTAVNRGAACN